MQLDNIGKTQLWAKNRIVSFWLKNMVKLFYSSPKLILFCIFGEL